MKHLLSVDCSTFNPHRWRLILRINFGKKTDNLISVGSEYERELRSFKIYYNPFAVNLKVNIENLLKLNRLTVPCTYVTGAPL
jgi:hypothetical protein